jgi:hypothetical protein
MPNRSRSPWITSVRERDCVELGKPCHRRLPTGAAWRHEREGETEDARGRRDLRRPARDARARRAAARHDRHIVRQLAAQPLDHGDPSRVEVMRRRRASPAGNTVRVLDEGDAQADLQGRVRGGREIRRRDATSRTVAEHEPTARRVHRAQVYASEAVRRIDVEHRRGVCRPMSSVRGAGRICETERKD